MQQCPQIRIKLNLKVGYLKFSKNALSFDNFAQQAIQAEDTCSTKPSTTKKPQAEDLHETISRITTA
jgi:hypothetical protein